MTLTCFGFGGTTIEHFHIQNNETEDMFVYHSNPVGVELFYYLHTFINFASNMVGCKMSKCLMPQRLRVNLPTRSLSIPKFKTFRKALTNMNVSKFPLLEYLLQQITSKCPWKQKYQEESLQIHQFYCNHSSPKNKCQVTICT